MTADQFIEGFVAKQRAKASELRSFGAAESAQATDQNARDLESAFREWWLSDLTVSEAADESGYSERHLRQLAQADEIPHKKGTGAKGHLRIARCDLPRRPKAKVHEPSDFEERMLRGVTRKAG